MRKVYFTNDTNGAKCLAVFLANLTIEGVAYKVEENKGGWAVEITGY